MSKLAARTLLRRVASAQLRTILPVGAVVCVGIVVLGLVLGTYIVLVGVRAYENALKSPDPLIGTVLAIMAPIALLAIFAVVLWVGVAVLAANAAVDARAASMPQATLLALRRTPRALAVIAATVLATIGLIVLTPVLMILGAAGLVSKSDQRPKSDYVAMVIPLGAAVVLAVRWSLALPSVYLSNLGWREALRDSALRVRGRAVRVGVALIVSLVVSFVASLIPVSGAFELVVRLTVLIVIGALPLVTATVLYRENASAPRLPRPSTVKTKVAALVAITLVVPLMIGSVPAPAVAAGATPVVVGLTTTPASPVPASTPVTVRVSVMNALTAEGTQPSGDLVISIDGTPLTGPFTLSGTPSIVEFTHSFSAGSHLIEAGYPGDAEFQSGTTSLTITATGATTPTTTVLSSSSPFANYGIAFTLEATVSAGATGTVEFFASSTSLGTATIAGGIATLDVSTLLPGSYPLTATYLGSGTHSASTSDAVPISVSTTSVSLSADIDPDSPSAAGGTLTLTATATAAGTQSPTGSVGVYLDGAVVADYTAPLVSGVASLPLVLAPGAHSIEVRYVPGAGFVSTATTISHTVGPFNSSMVVSADSASSVYGHDVELTATITATATPVGSVTFAAVPVSGPEVSLGSGVVNGSGVAVLVTDELPVGAISIVARFVGSAGVAAATSNSLSHTVSKAPVVVDVQATSATSSIGGTVGITATVTPEAGAAGSPTGTFTIKRDGVTVGTALPGVTTYFSVGDAGARQFTAEFEDTTGNFTSGSGSVDITVSQLATSTTLFGAAYLSHVYGDSLTFDGSVCASACGVHPTGTVQITVGGVYVADGPLDVNGNFSITTDQTPVGITLSRNVRAIYVGSTNFEGSVSSPVSLELVKAASNPVVTVDPVEPGFGGTATLIATLTNVGAGPSGSVSFTNAGSPLGSAPLVDGVASLSIPIDSVNYNISATYAGDNNFTAATSSVLTFAATRAAVTVYLDVPALTPYGSAVALGATVEVGGGNAVSHAVDFYIGSTYLGSATPNASDRATLYVCAGDAVACPGPEPRLGTSAATITAVYAESAQNIAGSATASYVPSGAVTTTTLSVTPSTVPHGSAIFLQATVSSGVGTPSGTVSFYGRNPDSSQFFLGNGTLSGGVATISVASGVDINWPTSAIFAQYGANAPFHTSSTDTKPITLLRVPVTISTPTASPAVAFAPTTVSVVMTQDPGASALFTQPVAITSDTGATCLGVFGVIGDRVAECTLTWDTAGTHTYTASYPGDSVYEAASSLAGSVTVGKANSAIAAAFPYSVNAFATNTVTWSLFHPSATGLVTVFADGTQVCQVAIAVQHCDVQFGASSVTGADVELRVRYDGNSAFIGDEDVLPVRVQGCITLDVYTSTGLGTVSVATAPNCGVSGYLAGTLINVVATPAAGAEFVNWMKFGTSGLEVASTAPSSFFAITADSSSGVFVAAFRPACFSVTAAATGSGTIDVYPASTCTTIAGEPGYSIGTSVFAYPTGLYNPIFDEADAFYAFGTLPVGVSLRHDSSNRAYVSLTVTGTTSIPVTFGPKCRTVSVAFAPSDPADDGAVVTPANCFDPAAHGFERFTKVTVSATSGLSSRVLADWAVNGTVDAALGHAPTATVKVDESNLVLTANFLDCFSVTVDLDSAVDARNRDIGEIAYSVAGNCPDGSERYLTGTELTLTPTVLVDQVSFTGWADVPLSQTVLRPKGAIPEKARTLAVAEDVTFSAGFYTEQTCSKLQVIGLQNLVSYVDTGCGDGYYYDLQKSQALRIGEPQPELWESSDRSVLTALVNPDVVLDVYVSVRGDTRNCFGEATQTQGPSTDITTVKPYGPLDRPSDTCEVGGNLRVQAQACQTVASTAQFYVNGDESEHAFSVGELPGSMLLQLPDGTFGTYSLADFEWVAAAPVIVEEDGITPATMQSGPCKDAGNAFAPDTDIAVYGFGPATGFTFAGWDNIDPAALIPSNPMIRTTTATESSMPVTAAFIVDCHTVTIQPGVSVVGTPAYCPGSDPAANTFIAGSAIQVAAAQQLNGNGFVGFIRGVVAGSPFVDEQTAEVNAFVLVDEDKTVTGDYPGKTESVGRAILQGLKILSGIAAVLAPIVLSALFPPAGLIFGLLAATAGLFSLLPGGDGPASVLDLMNPTKITTCAARWAFSKTDDPTGKLNAGAIIGTPKKIYTLYKGASAVTPVADLRGLASTAATTTSTLSKTVATLKSAAPGIIGAASFGYGLYDAGIGHSEFGAQTIEQLRGTQTMTGCLEDQWRVTGVDL